MPNLEQHYKLLQEHGVVPDVLPEGTKLSYGIKIKWPNAVLDTPGKELDREETQPEPSVYLEPAPQEKHDDYVLIMTDPDLMKTNDTVFGQVRHWLAVNVSVKEDGQLEIPQEAQISPYVGPAPLPNYVSPRPHRYTFILARPSVPSSSKVNVTPEDFRKLQDHYAAALKGKQREDVQDLKDRWGFNAQKFIENKGLKVEAVTYMRVGGNLKSAAANAALTAQALADKVLGR